MTDDITARARNALEATNCTDGMHDFFRVGDVRELLGEVERLRGALDRMVHRLTDELALDREPFSALKRSNVIADIEAVLRGDQ